MADSDSDSDKPSEISKLSRSDLILEYHAMDGRCDRLKPVVINLRERNRILSNYQKSWNNKLKSSK